MDRLKQRKTTAKFYLFSTEGNQRISMNVARQLGAEYMITTWPISPAEYKAVFTVICLHKQI